MSKSGILLVALSVVVLGGAGFAQQAPRANVIESYRRQDPTGMGSYHRFGLFRELDNSNTLAGAAGESATTPEDGTSWFHKLDDKLSMQFRANSMLFASDNIFNTEEDEQTDIQYAQFVGASLDAQFNDHWKLASSYDYAWFLHGKGENADRDFITSTVRQALSYERFLFNNKASITLPLSWQFSRLYNRATGDRTLDSWTYGAAAEFSWFLSSKVIPTFSYQYSYQDASGLNALVPDKHKHDFNLGVTLIPFEGKKFFVSPSIWCSNEQFFGLVRRDNAWTPTLAVTWQPLKYVAVDAVGSYTDSDSTLGGAGFDALTGTLFLRLFFNW